MWKLHHEKHYDVKKLFWSKSTCHFGASTCKNSSGSQTTWKQLSMSSEHIVSLTMRDDKKATSVLMALSRKMLGGTNLSILFVPG